ncbi:dihydroxyacetone kinase family protein [Gordonia rhizosphera]|uniref:Putative dihydroxyacetone kinase n=1 Tax=Gordonia rhizosphera NBRC 16068 TaxID=1108045 RepID=K6WUY2_9ACTN|nr:dihydroxyacetone kinase family protein [Gordonia rhizosphera]GAB90339.1 putative dihydroxyacetone kinase [Gordonia rhizosphera NBRC 16068]
MTRLFNDPASFTEDMLAGFLDANSRYVVGVPGGVVRATETPSGKVAVVVGGGSGHYPAFCGVVGPGFADGAVVGNVFTSPSAQQAASVARAAHGDSGVLLLTGNYAGDVMNFGLATSTLRDEGIDARFLTVTDDIASAPVQEAEKRRGIAGDFPVFRCASAAAEAGYSMDEVERVARTTNAATRTLGVAFDGCTMPGSDAPLFTVPDATMGLGLGIHGEPGVANHAMPRADELADLLVDGVLADAEKLPPPIDSRRIAVILNGLGRTKYEELFVVWKTASARLSEAGYSVIEPEIGELVTSLDMAGCSLTLTWLDDELETLWTSPADTPAYKRGAIAPAVEQVRRTAVASGSAVEATIESDHDSRVAAAQVVLGFEAVHDAIVDAEEELGRIDAVAGDGDHGRGMVRGITAALEAARVAAEAGSGAGQVFRSAGDSWAAEAGGTSGVLWGAALNAVGRRLGDEGTPDAGAIADAVRLGYQAMLHLGGAQPGDKTMLDAIGPFSAALDAAVSGAHDWRTVWRDAAEIATKSAAATANLVPKVGRARPLAERSVGTPDAGAVSFGLCVTTVADLLPIATH